MLDPSISTNQNAIEIKNRKMFVVEQKSEQKHDCTEMNTICGLKINLFCV